MKNLFFVLGASLLSIHAVAATQPTVYGSVVFGHGWEDMQAAPFGIYSVPTDGTSKVTPVKIDNNLTAFGGGVYVDGRYYLVDYSPYNYTGEVDFRVYDVDNGWKLLEEHHLSSYSSVASDLAYDPVGDRIYGCFREGPKSSNYFFGTLNTSTGFSSKIADLKEELIALASTKDGQLYGIGIYGMLYSIDKTTGTLTSIGQTGKNVKYAQSATFDYPSGRMLWAMTPHYTDESPEICEVNLSTGAATTLTTVPDRYQFTGIYTLGSYAPDGAPSKPTSLRADFDRGSLTGKVVFSMPSATMAGAKLGGTVGYRLFVDDNLAKEATAAAGSTVEPQLTLTRGLHHVKAVATNGSGRSPLAYLDFWAGNDVVNAVSPKVSMSTNGDINVVWTAPAAANHGGYFDPSDVSYVVTRMPDKVKVYEGKATSFTDAGAKALQIGNYYYDVVATTAGESGDAVSTNVISIGTSLSLPYLQDFNDEVSASILSVEDANGDGTSWQFFGNCYVCGISDEALDDDDWFFTPAFNLRSDCVYQVSIDAKADDDETCERIAIAAGTEARSGKMTQTIVEPVDVRGTDYKSVDGVFVPAHDGECHIGVHAVSRYADASFLYVDNLRVKQLGTVDVPSAAVGLTAKAQGGERKVDIEFVVPDKNMAGGSISSCDLTVRRVSDDVVVKTFKGAKAGERLSFTDKPMVDGMTAYEVVPSNNFGQGPAASVSVYVGMDVPGAVGNLRISATDDGAVAASWTAPAAGIHGGAVDTGSMKYNVGNVGGSTLRSTVVDKPSFGETLSLGDAQHLAWYVVSAETAQGKGPELSTDTIFVGKPYALPYAESFARRSMQKGPWLTTENDAAKWDIMLYGSFADAADLDNGLIAFSTVTPGASADFIGPKLSLKNTANPRLTFYSWNMKRSIHQLHVSVATPDGKRVAVGSFVPNDFDQDGNEGMWRKYTYSLADFKAYDYVQLVFTGVGGDTDDLASIVPLYVDQISVDDPLDCNLTMDNLEAPIDKVSVGDNVDFYATVQNKSNDDATDFDVCLYRGDRLVSTTHVDALAAGKSKEIQLVDTPNADAPVTSLYKAVVKWSADKDASDNESKTVVVTVLPGRPFVAQAEARAAGDNASVSLSWSEPPYVERGTEPETVCEDFESYAPFTITHFGEWTLADLDGASTLGIQDGTGNFVQYDNVESPMAFQIFNPSAVGISTTLYPTHSGKQVAAAFSSGRYSANDDWLISPEVDGAQTVKFWACSPDSRYYGTQEHIEVLYSTGANSTSEFKKIGSTIKVPAQWTEYSVDLPAGTRYFAIRCTSSDQYILFLDDITYRKAARNQRLLGYNVYRNGTLLTASPIAATSFVDSREADKSDVYSVSAVYNTGESRHTDAAWDGLSAITTPVGNDSTGPVAIYDITGRRLPDADSMTRGVYIIREGSKVRKIRVR